MGCVSSKKKLSKADLQFLQENTEFTKEQIVEWYEGFIVSSRWSRTSRTLAGHPPRPFVLPESKFVSC